MTIFIEGRRNGYSPDQCGRTMTVEQLMNFLSHYPLDAKIYLQNDGGYTYGNINEFSFSEDDDEEEDDEEE